MQTLDRLGEGTFIGCARRDAVHRIPVARFRHAAPTAVLPDEESPHDPGASPGGSGASDHQSLTLGLAPGRAQALREALAAHARGNHPAASELQDLLHEASASARARGITAERLLVEFKLLWYALPEVRALRPPQQTDALGELVTLCIRAYFEDGAG